MGCIGDIIWDQSTFYEGPFQSGETDRLVAKVAMINNGDRDGRITCDLYEYPGDPVKEKLLRHSAMGFEPGSKGSVYFREDIPKQIESWPLGVKVWCEGESKPVWGNTNTRRWDVQVCVCTKGESEILEYCPDGSVKKERRCENGKWVIYEYDCESPKPPPPTPECAEGESEIVEYCSDGVTVKEERRCENGKWITYHYDCPDQPETIIQMIVRRIRELLGLETYRWRK